MTEDEVTRERVTALIKGNSWPYAIAVLWAWCRDENIITTWLECEPALLWGDPNAPELMCHPAVVERCIADAFEDFLEVVRKSQKLEVAAGARIEADTVDYAITKEKDADVTPISHPAITRVLS